MISSTKTLLIGAANRNSGKTKLACELIRRHSAKHKLFGIKITTIHKNDGVCPRGGEGCGVCTSFNGDYLITEEVLNGEKKDTVGEGASEKDTIKMLRAGAQRVFWLRALREHLEAGVRAMLDLIPEDTLVVCESNSARTVLQPGLFIAVQEAGSKVAKASYEAVRSHADLVVNFDGKGWDCSSEGANGIECIDRMVVVEKRWMLRPFATAVILAGGKSRRMGTDKSLLHVSGKPMIAHIADQLDFFPERIIGSDEPDKYAFLNLPVIPDQEPGKGVLMGIMSCVDRASYDLCFVTGCDIPKLDSSFVMEVLDRAREKDIVVPRFSNNLMEPLLGVYRKTIVPVARKILESGGRRIVELMDHLDVGYVPAEGLLWYANLNTMEDYRAWVSSKAVSRRRKM